MLFPEAVIVFGGSGFIGRNLIEALVRRGTDVIAVSRTGQPIRGCLASVSMDDLSAMGHLPEDANVVNLAAHRYDASNFRASQSEILVRNVDLTTTIYHFCVQRGITEVRMASSVAVYPEGLSVLDDSVPVDLNKMPNRSEAFYAWSKRWAEICARVYREQYGVNTLTFRISNPYGPYDSTDVNRAHVLPTFIMKALSNQPEFEIMGSPQAERDFIFVGDVVEVFLRSLERREEHNTYNLCTGVNVTIGELAQMVMRTVGADKPIRCSDAGVSDVAVRRATTARLTADFHIDAFTPLTDGLQQTVPWYRHALGR